MVPGSVLHYTVCLTNGGDEPIDLGSCPGYEQELAPEHGESLAGGRWRLACDGQPAIARGTSARYAMELTVPKTATSGDELSLT